jgi:hypothetical protein
MTKKNDLIGNARRLLQETGDMSRRAEDRLRDEFLAYVRSIRAREINSQSKMALAEEVVATAKMVVEALVNDDTETSKR